MSNKKTTVIALFLIIALCLTSCSPAAKTRKENEQRYAPQNEIFSYEPIDLDKTVIVFTQFGIYDLQPLEKAIEEKFPDVDIVIAQGSAGTEQMVYMQQMAQNGKIGDMIITNATEDLYFSGKYFYDLSGCDFISRYSLASLQDKTRDGKLYQLPVLNTGNGIFYNKTLFTENGWSVPETLDEFYTLCDTISETGVRPFVPCLKYNTTIVTVALGLSIGEMTETSEKMSAFKAYLDYENSGTGVIEPMLEALIKLYDRGIITEADFSSSATQNRKDLYAGKVAMIPYNLDFYSFYIDEKPDCEIGFFGYPTDTKGERWVLMSSGSGILFSQSAMEDENKRDKLIAIADFISTEEGQDALFTTTSGVSSLKSYQNKLFTGLEDLQSCLDNGCSFFREEFAIGNSENAFSYISGEVSVEEYLVSADKMHIDPNASRPDLLAREPIGTATSDFTMLETSIYNAEVMKNASGADIALIPHGSFYKGNIAHIYEGGIVLPEIFILKSISKDNFLTVYNITGANLKALLERPIIDGAEQDFLYAFSGLKMEYAPWASEGENVKSVTLADGAEIDDSATYTVAAWATSIDESFITSVEKELPDAGMNYDIMTAAIS